MGLGSVEASPHLRLTHSVRPEGPRNAVHPGSTPGGFLGNLLAEQGRGHHLGSGRPRTICGRAHPFLSTSSKACIPRASVHSQESRGRGDPSSPPWAPGSPGDGRAEKGARPALQQV